MDQIKTLCGSNMGNNLNNLEYLLSLHKVYEIRTVIALDYMDVENTICKVASILKNYPEVRYKLIRIHLLGLSDSQKEKLKDKIPTQDYMSQLEEKAVKLGVKNVEIVV